MNINWLKKDKGLLVLIAIFLISTPIFLTPWVHGNDGAGYYVYVRSAFIDKDLDFKNEWEHFSQTTNLSAVRIDTNTGKYFSQYPLGTSLLWAPYYLLGHLIAFFASYETDGYSFPYVFMVCLGSAINAFIGLVLMYFLLKKYFSRSIALLSVITIWFASNLFYYMYFESSLSHANSFLAVSLILFFWDRSFGKRTPAQWAFLGFLFGIAFLIRYQEVLFLLLPFVEAISILIKKKENLAGQAKKYLLFCVAFFLTAMPQLIVLKMKHGAFALNYSGGFNVLDVPVNFLKVLFSSNHGLFNWHPVLLLAFVGLILLYKKRKLFSSSFIAIFLMNLVLISGWSAWEAGQSFGHRIFISTFPLLTFGLAMLLEELNKKISLKYLVIGCFALILWNFGLMVQYGSRMISVDGHVSLMERAYNNFAVVPKKIFALFWKFLFKRGSFLR